VDGHSVVERAEAPSAGDSLPPVRSRIDPGWALAIVVGGAAGTLIRVGLEQSIPSPGGWPIATLAANLVGAALLGALSSAVFRRVRDGSPVPPLLGGGLCGALTSFAAIQIEVVDLVRDGGTVTAGLYLLATVLGGLAAVAGGRALGARLVS